MYEQKTIKQLEEELKCDVKNGLSKDEVQLRQKQYGKNVLVEKKSKTVVQMFLTQLNEPMIYILFVAVIISLLLKEFSDAGIILLVILVNAVIGVLQEGKAQKALEALKKLSSPMAVVKREGKLTEIPASELVVGDLVMLDAGRQVPADLRLTFSSNMKIEESALTGESVPVNKNAEFITDKKLSLGDRINMAYMTTGVSYGRGEGIVIASGMDTEIGKIAKMINETSDDLTPLQKRLSDLGKLLGILAVVLCIALFIIAVIQKRDIPEMLITAISLAVAAVPEGLPAVVTIVLALGVQRLVKVNTIVRRLPSVETLGAVSVVCSDKTGTLTQNKMTVIKAFTNEIILNVNELDKIPNKNYFLKGFLLCNDASVLNGQRLGDPTELALLDMAANQKLFREELEKEMPRINELPFDSDRKMMTTVHESKDGLISFTKGATDVIIKRCKKILINNEETPITEDYIKNITTAVKTLSSEALRVLALAIRKNTPEAKEEDLTFVGLVGMIDPPRPEAAEAVKIFKEASVKTIMITGDHIETAFAIAKELGIANNINQCVSGDILDTMSQNELSSKIDNYNVFARVSPEHKVLIVNALKSRGYIVSMTGDGVNDAPSLKTADIGVAMGITGTDVAKSAADMVLTDDNFATIQKAIEEGRGIYANIKKSVLFLLSSNFGEIITMFIAILCGLAAPLKAIHILWVNLITDSLPGLALGVDNNDSTDMMRQPPRDPKESLFAKGGLFTTLFYGIVIAFISLLAFLSAPILSLTRQDLAVNLANIINQLKEPSMLNLSQTYAFTVLGLSQLFHAVGMRNVNKSIFLMNHLSNKLMLAAFFIGFILQIAVTEIPLLINVFGTVGLSLSEWIGLVALSTLPLWMHEILLLFKRK
ncbi:MAG: P-type superfamily ATPase [Clostridia bacterium]|nr:P-type superfamily ATPase [Clostridia bacterium]